MKNFAKIIAILVTLVFVLSIFAGCGGAKKDKVVIGLSLPTQREERWVRDKIKMEEEAKKLGVELKVQISDNDAGKQASQVENLLSQGVDILIIAPHDAKSAAALIDVAHKAKVKVISYDRLIMDSDVDLYISFDNVEVGRIQGRYITKVVPKGNYVVLAGAPTDNNATLFRQGAMEIIQPLVDKGDIKVVMDQAVKDWQPSEAMKLVENALTANANNIQAILSPNDGCAGGAIQALSAQKLDGKIPITGQDAELAAAQRIMAGTQNMTVFKDTRALGEAAIAAAVKMVKGEEAGVNNKVNNGKKDVPSILLKPLEVTKENLEKLLIESGYLKKEDVIK